MWAHMTLTCRSGEERLCGYFLPFNYEQLILLPRRKKTLPQLPAPFSQYQGPSRTRRRVCLQDLGLQGLGASQTQAGPGPGLPAAALGSTDVRVLQRDYRACAPAHSRTHTPTCSWLGDSHVPPLPQAKGKQGLPPLTSWPQHTLPLHPSPDWSPKIPPPSRARHRAQAGRKGLSPCLQTLPSLLFFTPELFLGCPIQPVL